LRVAIVNCTHRLVGGVEIYLQRLIPELLLRSAEIAFVSELVGDDSRPAILDAPTLADVPIWCIAKLGADASFAALRKWRPDVIYVHGIQDAAVERELLAIAPAVFYAHVYSGTCISGRKSFRTPLIEPCDRTFGAACLAYYYPRRCGGLNPVTMWRDYRRSESRLHNLRRYRAILASSEHMRREYLHHGFEADSVHLVHLPITEHKSPTPSARTAIDRSRQFKLLFAGRMVFEKGGGILISAMPRVASILGRPLHLDLVGEGNALAQWQDSAREIARRNSEVTTTFHPWLESADLAIAFDGTDLLIVPSVWPEPFGLTGPEAGLHHVPAAAFAIGGIPEWLHENVNGHLADAHPCKPENLAAAIAECLRDESHYSALREGAYQMASQFDLSTHVTRLLEIFSASVPT
jgi:glycosyltransferase involved in cell wall biosynthesis